jgi:F-type H+-transporting ATPase subunit c
MVASPLFGQTPNNPTANGHWVAISAGFSMAIASGMCGLAQAKAVAAAAEGMARNPGAAAAIRFALLLGLVLIESLALYTLVIIFVKVWLTLLSGRAPAPPHPPFGDLLELASIARFETPNLVPLFYEGKPVLLTWNPDYT